MKRAIKNAKKGGLGFILANLVTTFKNQLYTSKIV